MHFHAFQKLIGCEKGFSIQTRWKWNETVGDLRYRKGRIGQWEYFNTNG